MRWPPLLSGGRRVDLHTHTIFSDGVLTPEALVARARDRRLAAIAVTDHDSVEGLPRALAAAGPAIEVIPGIELSSAVDGLDLHILGFFVSPDDDRLRARLERFRLDRRERALVIMRRLAEQGAPLDTDLVLQRAAPGVIGRPHVAGALVEAGYAESIDAAFRRYLGARGSAYVPRPAFSPAEAIELIHAADGISVLAHPGPALGDDVIERLAAMGLRGIEVWHPAHAAPTVRRYRALAERLRLVETGGSDFHMEGRGADIGGLGVPAGILGPLKAAAGVAG
jgi:predicted metal-dependent phosphoesterase TrpH